MTNFMIAANEGREMPPLEAMTELAYFFTHSVEGTYENTVTYEAGTVWLEIYKKDKNIFENVPASILFDCTRPSSFNR